MLAAYVPDLEVHVVEGDGGDVLADGGDGGFVGYGVVVVEGFDGGEEGGFAGVVEAEEQDGVFCGRALAEWTMASRGEEKSEKLNTLWGEVGRGSGGDMPSLDVAQKYTLLARWYILTGECDL